MDTIFTQREGEDFTARLERIARSLRVPLRNATPSDDWFMSNLSYGVDQEIAAAERRLELLKHFRDCYTA